MRNKNKAFTLIELLVVISIIAALVAILSVGQRKVKIIQKNLQQKASFHAITIGLELFSKDFGDYPDSSLITDGTTYVTGAQRLAEAMRGRDELGFHPRSRWHPAAEATAGLTLYDLSVEDTTKQRKPVYTELKHCGFYTLDALWGVGATPGIEPTPVITDVFAQNRVTINGESQRVGMPILYFKANPGARFRVQSDRTPVNPVTNNQASEYRQWVYNFEDNFPLLQLPWLRDPAVAADGLDKHYQQDPDNPVANTNAQLFYEMLTRSERDTTGDGEPDFFSPENASSFILISAGYDGIFGTKDDLTNFDD